jgi:hypothetical protein
MSKNAVYAVIIVVCLLVAGFMAYRYVFSGGSGGLDSIPEDQMVWVKCNNPACKAEYQMGKRKFFEEVEKRFNPLGQTRTAITCEKCGQESCYEAIKCSNPECGIIFFKGIVSNDIEDRCPQCKHSAIEDSRKARLAER